MTTPEAATLILRPANKMVRKSIILVILDGWGIGEKNASNPLWQAKLPTFDYIKRNWPATTLQAAGIAVGLPWGEEGNSEVGHLTLGSGKVIYQHLPRITMAIREKTFFQNPVLLKAVEHAKTNGSTLHLLGLLSSAQVHSSYAHLEALIDLASQLTISNGEVNVDQLARRKGYAVQVLLDRRFAGHHRLAALGVRQARDPFHRPPAPDGIQEQGQGALPFSAYRIIHSFHRDGLGRERRPCQHAVDEQRRAPPEQHVDHERRRKPEQATLGGTGLDSLRRERMVRASRAGERDYF